MPVPLRAIMGAAMFDPNTRSLIYFSQPKATQLAPLFASQRPGRTGAATARHRAYDFHLAFNSCLDDSLGY
jgi:hypothetical protein